MDFLNLIENRYSCRNFLEKKVEKEKVNKILQCGRIAPTACNMQPQRIFVLDEKEILEKLSSVANIYNAPLALVVCGDKNNVWTRPFDKKTTLDIDTSIVTAYMMAEAFSLGIKSVWICFFDPAKVKNILNISDELEVISILALGYSDEKVPSSERYLQERLPLDETVFFNKK